MGYKEEIRGLENYKVKLENERYEIKEKLQKEDAGGKSVSEWYDAANDHFHQNESYRAPSANYTSLTKRLEEVEKELKVTEEKLKEAKLNAPIMEKEEKALAAQKKAKEESKTKEKSDLDEKMRKINYKFLKDNYKATFSKSERLSFALKGRSPKWRKIKKLGNEELEFLRKASGVKQDTKVEIESRDKEIGKKTSDKVAEIRRKDYYLKLLRVRSFLEDEVKKNSPKQKSSYSSRSHF